MSMITATSWVPRGFAAQFPAKYNFTEEEYDRIAQLAKLQLDDANEDLDEAKNENANGTGTGLARTAGEVDNDLKEYDLEHYDDEDEDDGVAGITGENPAMGIFGNVKSLVYHASNDEDPYITRTAADDEDEEREEMQILPTDSLVLAAKMEDEIAHLEVYVYEDEADNLYVHHDIMLPAIPICVEWLDVPVGKPDADPNSRGNSVAIGTMDPDIEIWDLDTVDCMYPNAILGQGARDGGTEKPRKKKKKSRKPRDEYHVDAVLSLAANLQHRNLLASASADNTVKLWDLNTGKCAKSYSYHTDKVCSIAWHAQESTALLSGSYDRTVIAADMRAPESGQRCWTVDSDVESVKWDPHDPNHFYVATESGLLSLFDARKTPAAPPSTAQLSASIWKLQAHDSALSAFDANPTLAGFLATGSTDKTVKLWKVPRGGGGPSMVTSRDLGVGRVFSANFAPDSEVAFGLAVAGSKGDLRVWDTSTNKAVRMAFMDRPGIELSRNAEAAEKIVGVEEEPDEESSDEAEGEGGEVGEGEWVDED